MRLGLAALVATTGCAQLFGIDDTTRADASSDVASVQVQKVSIGASVIRTPLDMSNQTATFYDDSAMTLAPIPGVQTALDTFSASAPGTPSVIYTVPDAQVPTRMLALPARVQKTNYVELEHPNPQEPLPNSSLVVSVALPTMYALGESFSIQAIGAWMQHGLTASELPPPDTGGSAIDTSIPYSVFTSMLGATQPKVRITNADEVLLLRYTGTRLSGVLQAQFEQTDGADPISGTMTAVAASTMMTATYDAPGFATRFGAVRPAVAGASLGWHVNAAPGWSLGVDAGVRLVNGNARATDPSFMTSYGNPFESLDWKALFLFSSSANRSYPYTEGTTTAAVVLSANMTAVGDPATTSSVNMAAGLPITIQANDLALVNDGMTLPLDLTKPVVVQATLDKPTNTQYELTLVQLGVDLSGTSPVLTRTTIVDAVTAGAPQFRLPPALFTVGKSYYIVFRAYQGGVGNAAAGDAQTVTLPYSFASLDSAVFTVGMP